MFIKYFFTIFKYVNNFSISCRQAFMLIVDVLSVVSQHYVPSIVSKILLKNYLKNK